MSPGIGEFPYGTIIISKVLEHRGTRKANENRRQRRRMSHEEVQIQGRKGGNGLVERQSIGRRNLHDRIGCSADANHVKPVAMAGAPVNKNRKEHALRLRGDGSPYMELNSPITVLRYLRRIYSIRDEADGQIIPCQKPEEEC